MMDGVHAGLPAGFTGFNASGIPDINGEQGVVLPSLSISRISMPRAASVMPLKRRSGAQHTAQGIFCETASAASRCAVCISESE